MRSRGGGGRRRAENGGYWWVQPLKPLIEGPDLELMQDDHEFISNKEGTLLITTTTSYNNSNSSSSSSWQVLREWFRVHKSNSTIRSPNGNGNGNGNAISIMSTLMYYNGSGGGVGGGIRHIRAKRPDLRLLLGVLGCPLAPIPLMPITTNFPVLHRPQIIKDIPIETSTAHYIIEQYLAATGCIKQQRSIGGGGESMMMIKNMYTTGTVKMICCETEISPSLCSSSSSTISGKMGGGGRVKSVGSRSRGENGCFVLWQMSPGMWSLELVVGNGPVDGGSGDKVIAGSDGKIVWRHTPWLGTHAAKGPQRPLRRVVQVS